MDAVVAVPEISASTAQLDRMVIKGDPVLDICTASPVVLTRLPAQVIFAADVPLMTRVDPVSARVPPEKVKFPVNVIVCAPVVVFA
jgi:hypothetical protein